MSLEARATQAVARPPPLREDFPLSLTKDAQVEAGSLVDSRRPAGLHPAPNGNAEAADGTERSHETDIGSGVGVSHVLSERGQILFDRTAARGLEVDKERPTRRNENVSVEVRIAVQ